MHNYCWFVSYSIIFLYSTLQKSPLDYVLLHFTASETAAGRNYITWLQSHSKEATKNDTTNKLLTEVYLQNLLECIINQNRQIVLLVLSWF